MSGQCPANSLKSISINFPAKRLVIHPPPKKNMYIRHVYPKQSDICSLKTKLRYVLSKKNMGWNCRPLSTVLLLLRYEYEPFGTNLKICTHTHTQNQKKPLLQDVEVKCCILEGQLLLNSTSLLQVCHAKCSAGYVHPL